MRSVGRYAPALLLMGIIFALSAQSYLPGAEGELDVLLKKGAHMTEYGVLFLLWTWALGAGRARSALWALCIAVLYAVSDEVHQAFVPGRHPSPFDVAIDAAGIGLAAAGWIVWRRARPGTPGVPPNVSAA